MTNQTPPVCLFFYVNDKFLTYGCPIEKGEHYGDFVNYPYSHYKVWNKLHLSTYGVEFDYYPRGRVVYRKSDDTFILYYDKCVEAQIAHIAKMYSGKRLELSLDEHYKCHMCNDEYAS